MEIKQLAAEQLGSTRLAVRGELRHLPRFLQEGEVVVGLAGATFAKWWKAGLCVATESRLLLVHKWPLLPARCEDVPYERIKSLYLNVGPSVQELSLNLVDGTLTLSMTAGSARELIRALSERTGGLTRKGA